MPFLLIKESISKFFKHQLARTNGRSAAADVLEFSLRMLSHIFLCFKGRLYSRNTMRQKGHSIHSFFKITYPFCGIRHRIFTLYTGKPSNKKLSFLKNYILCNIVPVPPCRSYLKSQTKIQFALTY